MPTQGWPCADGDHVKARREVAESLASPSCRASERRRRKSAALLPPWHPLGLPARHVSSVLHLGSLFVAVLVAPVFA